MQDILYGEWGYDGVVVTDWGGENDRVAGLIAGNQLEMPSSSGSTDREVVEAVRAGELDEALLDARVNSLLELIFSTRREPLAEKPYTVPQHHEAAREAARRAAVLVKNEGDVLPLAPNTRVAVIGDFARVPRYQGAGSSLIAPTWLDNALDALKQSDLSIVGYEPGFRRFGGASSAKRRRAVTLARRADVALVFLGLDEGSEAEGVDRAHMRLPENQIALLAAVRAACAKVVVVLASGAPVEAGWAADADAVLLGYLGGQAGGGAIADLVTGRAAPSGKLAETYPLVYADVASAGVYPGHGMTAEHRESIFIGYRYYDTAKKAVAWPFGFGLTYTTFAYENLTVEGGEVCFTVRNTGARAGEEIAQVYVAKRNSNVFRAEQELKGFTRAALEPGEEKILRIRLDEHAFCYYDMRLCAWVEEPGEYEIRVGASSRDILLRAVVVRQGEAVPAPYERAELPHYFNADVADVPDGEFAALLGRPLPQSEWDATAPLGYLDTIGQGKYKRGFARFLYGVIQLARQVCFLFGKPVAGNNVMFAMHLPYRALMRMSGGIIDKAMLDGILVMANGYFWRGLRQTLCARSIKKRRGRGDALGNETEKPA